MELYCKCDILAGPFARDDLQFDMPAEDELIIFELLDFDALRTLHIPFVHHKERNSQFRWLYEARYLNLVPFWLRLLAGSLSLRAAEARSSLITFRRIADLFLRYQQEIHVTCTGAYGSS